MGFETVVLTVVKYRLSGWFYGYGERFAVVLPFFTAHDEIEPFSTSRA